MKASAKGFGFSCVAFALALGGCGSDGAETTSGSASGGASSSGQGGATAVSVSSAGGGNDTSGCTKVDFLFVVDNSVSMQDQQQALITSFPGFIDTIQQTVAANSDYHILVADTDAWGRCNTANPWTGVDPTSSTCNAYIKNTAFEECDRTRGAGVVHAAGEFASNAVCSLQGQRYIVEGQTDLSNTFACMAQVGVAGHPSERPMDAMVAALSAPLNEPGGCNEGFLRDDAILVITFISDDPNYEDSGTPQEWYDAVVAAKGGNADAIVVLGLTPNFAGCQDGKGPPKGSHWSEFIAMWGTRGIEASVCDSDYSPFFQQAVAIIDETCDDFVPVE